jgi:hypothetical protein
MRIRVDKEPLKGNILGRTYRRNVTLKALYTPHVEWKCVPCPWQKPAFVLSGCKLRGFHYLLWEKPCPLFMIS